MNPKKAKDIVPLIATKHDISETLVTDITSFFWKEVKKEMSEVRSANIMVQGLGTFKARPWTVPDTVKKYQNIVNKYKGIIDNGGRITMQKFAIMKEAEVELERLLILQEQINGEKERKKTIKQLRNGRKNCSNMEKPLENH